METRGADGWPAAPDTRLALGAIRGAGALAEAARSLRGLPDWGRRVAAAVAAAGDAALIRAVAGVEVDGARADLAGFVVGLARARGEAEVLAGVEAQREAGVPLSGGACELIAKRGFDLERAVRLAGGLAGGLGGPDRAGCAGDPDRAGYVRAIGLAGSLALARDLPPPRRWDCAHKLAGAECACAAEAECGALVAAAAEGGRDAFLRGLLAAPPRGVSRPRLVEICCGDRASDAAAAAGRIPVLLLMRGLGARFAARTAARAAEGGHLLCALWILRELGAGAEFTPELYAGLAPFSDSADVWPLLEQRAAAAGEAAVSCAVLRGDARLLGVLFDRRRDLFSPRVLEMVLADGDDKCFRRVAGGETAPRELFADGVCRAAAVRAMCAVPDEPIRRVLRRAGVRAFSPLADRVAGLRAGEVHVAPDGSAFAGAPHQAAAYLAERAARLAERAA